MSDNEHTTAPLGHSEPLRVKNAVGEPIPQACQVPEYGKPIPSVVDGQNSGDVFSKKPLGTLLGKNAGDFVPQSASFVSHSRTPSSHAVSLAGPPGCEDIGSQSRSANSGNVFICPLSGEVLLSDAIAFRIQFCGVQLRQAAPAQTFIDSANTRKQGPKGKHMAHIPSVIEAS
jgi:hypothetical protein